MPSDNKTALIINGSAAQGNLYFKTYHFTGINPRTKWEGEKPAALNKGWYVSLRELQYYGELSGDFKKTTTTHEKLIKLQQALHNRKNKKEECVLQ